MDNLIFDLTANNNSRKVPILNTSYPQDVTLKATDGSAEFSAVIAKQGRPDKYTYQWYVNGIAVADATGSSYARNVSGDKGVYSVWCEVTNKAGTVRTREATLTVNRLPVLDSNYPANTSIKRPNSVTSTVSIAEPGYPDAYTYQWYNDGVAVSGETSSSYTFTPAAVGTTELYCEVTNSAGTVTSRTATITATMLYAYRGESSGWVSCATGSNGWSTGTVSHSGGAVVLKSTETNGLVAGCINKKFNFTPFNRIRFKIGSNSYNLNGSGNTWVAVINKNSLGNWSADTSGSALPSGVVASKKFTSSGDVLLDVSGLSGEYYIAILATRVRTVYCTQVQFEP